MIIIGLFFGSSNSLPIVSLDNNMIAPPPPGPIEHIKIFYEPLEIVQVPIRQI
jgi:hypothetical protein